MVQSIRTRLSGIHPAAWLTFIAAVIFATVFGRLGVQNHRNFGTWSYDMGIYDQAAWLVSRGESFMSVRGLDVWGHHVNLVFFLFAPAYWLGAGPEFLYIVQACVLALGAIPMYLIARDLFRNSWMGLVFAISFLMYAPMQWITWAMFHPEALVITPFLFAWWFATQERWRWYFAMVLISLSMREDVALAVVMLGFVLAVYQRNSPDRRRVWRHCASTVLLGGVWYLIATRWFLPAFNDGKQPFYVTYFYGNYGSDMPEIVNTMLRYPNRVVSDAVQHDRLEFYKQLSWPVGWLPLANPLGLLMAAPQMLASVIGLSPYARMIKYQYTSVMIAPIMIAAIHGGHRFWRFRHAKWALPAWILVCAYITNVAWAPSPIGEDKNYVVWSVDSERNESLRTALTYIPDDAAVSATYQLLPHLSHRREIYDWPNPFWPAVWGNDDCDHLPSPTTIDYVILDRTQIGPDNQNLYTLMTNDGGPFETVFSDENVVVLHRVDTDDSVDVAFQREGCRNLDARYGRG